MITLPSVIVQRCSSLNDDEMIGMLRSLDLSIPMFSFAERGKMLESDLHSFDFDDLQVKRPLARRTYHNRDAHVTTKTRSMFVGFLI